MTKCPTCKTTEYVRVSNRHRLFDDLLRRFGFTPFRCDSCRTRFFRLSSTAQPVYTPPPVKPASPSWPAGLPSRARLDEEAYTRKSA